MLNFKIDYSGLADKITKRAYKLEDVKDKIERVAFDIVRFKDADKGADLWQVQSADDGEQYIVSMYEPEEAIISEASWNVVANTIAGDIQISYKGDPLVRIASSKLGIPVHELHKVQSYLPSKLAENKKLVKALLNELGKSAKEKVLSKYPELV
jgi:hypothetical protein